MGNILDITQSAYLNQADLSPSPGSSCSLVVTFLISAFFLFLIASIASFSSRLRFFLFASVSGCASSSASSSTAAGSASALDGPSPFASASRLRRS